MVFTGQKTQHFTGPTSMDTSGTKGPPYKKHYNTLSCINGWTER